MRSPGGECQKGAEFLDTLLGMRIVCWCGEPPTPCWKLGLRPPPKMEDKNLNNYNKVRWDMRTKEVTESYGKE